MSEVHIWGKAMKMTREERAERRLQIAQEVRSGQTITEVMDKYEVSRPMVHKAVAELEVSLGVSVKPKRGLEERKIHYQKGHISVNWTIEIPALMPQKNQDGYKAGPIDWTHRINAARTAVEKAGCRITSQIFSDFEPNGKVNLPSDTKTTEYERLLQEIKDENSENCTQVLREVGV